MGRLMWTLRRPALYGVVAFVICSLFGPGPIGIVSGAIPQRGEYEVFSAYMFWSIFGLVITLLLSMMYAKHWDHEEPYSWMITKFIIDDVISSVWCLIQLPYACVARKRGREIDWFGVVFDFFWTLAWLIIVIRGIAHTI